MTNFEKFATGVMLAGLLVTAAGDLWRRTAIRKKRDPGHGDGGVDPLSSDASSGDGGDGGGD